MDPLFLPGDTCAVRTWRADDVDYLYEAVRESISHLSPWLPWCTETYCRKESLDWVKSRATAWAEDEEFSFVIADLSDSRLLGGIGLHRLNWLNRNGELGYWIRTSESGKGYCSEAARIVTRWAFESLELQRIEILASTRNAASLRVAAKAGGTCEGILRRKLVLDGVVHDAALYSVIRSDIRGD